MNDFKKWACNILKSVLQAKAPYDTGNLAINGIWIANDGSGVLIGGKEAAPYAVYTNESWADGKNPNEGWIDRAIQEALPIIEQALSGKITKEQYEETMRFYGEEFDRRLESYKQTLIEERAKLEDNQS